MGLGTTHDCWHGPYSSFNSFRETLASEIGLNLREMDGFGGDMKWDNVKHGIKSLLNHSDCEGDLSPVECKDIVEGFDEIILTIDIDKVGVDFMEDVLQFRNGCLKAYQKGESVEFH